MQIAGGAAPARSLAEQLHLGSLAEVRGSSLRPSGPSPLLLTLLPAAKVGLSLSSGQKLVGRAPQSLRRRLLVHDLVVDGAPYPPPIYTSLIHFCTVTSLSLCLACGCAARYETDDV